MKKYLVQSMVGGDLIVSLMSLSEIKTMLRVDADADFLQGLMVYDVDSEFGVVKQVQINELVK